jgi:ComF family protein
MQAFQPIGEQRPAAGLIRRLLRAGLDFVYPPGCAACGAATGAPHGLCGPCWARMAFIERPFCERLGTPFAYDAGMPLLSPAAMAEPPVFGRARAVTRYDGQARELVQRLKFGDRLDVALVLGSLMARAGAELLADADLLVPVPLHRRRLWRRRFNQSAELAGVVAERSGKPLGVDALKRVKASPPQVGLTRDERRHNLQGAFRVGQGDVPEIAGRHILLIDDVLTTGSTGNAAARALLKAGASGVDLLVFALVAREG